MRIILCLAATLLFGCSVFKKRESPIDYDQPEGAKAPEWVYAPDLACGQSEICAAGEGESMSQADARARAALASVFSTKVQSQLDIHKTSLSDEEVSELKEYVNSQVSETVEGVLKSVEIKRRFEKDALFFSLASLDKSKASDSLNRELGVIDNELNHLYRQKRKSSIKRMMALLEQRSILVDKLIVLNGGAGRPPVTFSQIQNIKYSSKGYNKVYLRAGEDVPVTLAKHVEQVLTSSGYQVLDNMAVDYIIDLKYETKQAYLNVEGFKKFVFTFSASANNNVNEKVGAFTVVSSQAGRTKQDAYLKAKSQIQEEIENKFDKLNLK